MSESKTKKVGHLVFGGNGFLGREFVEALSSQGQTVFSADREGPGESYDLVDPDQVLKAFEDYFRLFPQATHLNLILSTGHSIFTDTLNRTKKELADVLETNLQIPVFCLNEFIRQTNARKLSGSVVLLSSVFAQKVPNFNNYRFLNRRNSEIYGASKAGIEQITRYYAQLIGQSGLRINAVAPGGVYNQTIHPKDFVKAYSDDTALGRMTRASEIVSAVLFLLSDESSGITGQVLNVDAGYRL